jgi:ubiquinone/menaquinone biosynthesis C-methylase UbiE
MEDGPRSADEYDSMAEAYAADNLESPYNAYYERPATKRLLGDVSGKRVLEVGCGAGPLTEWLVQNDALVTAMDVSPEMVRLARARAGDRARIIVGDLAVPLAAPSASFDVVVASLVLHYLRDWVAPLREIHRVLVSHGALVFSTHHPTMDARDHSPEDYFAIKQITETWTKGTDTFDVTFWRRPLTAMTEAINEAGFVIEHLVEPMPEADLRERDPASYELMTTQPRFLFFRLSPSDSWQRPNT